MITCTLLAAFALAAAPGYAEERRADVFTGVGFAPISAQPAKTDEERRLLAIRASYLAALRNLAEQVHGVNLEARSSATGRAMQTDSIQASVSGTIVGARIVTITPKADDTYQTIVEMPAPASGAH